MKPVLKDYFEINILRISKGCPWQNDIIEKYWKTLQIELIDRLHIQDEASIRYFSKKFQIYYNETKPRQALLENATSKKTSKDISLMDYNKIKYQKVKHAHGFFTVFKIAA
jgi:transposase InsO family protein